MPRVDERPGTTYRDDDRIPRFDTLTMVQNEVARLWMPPKKFAWIEWTHTLRGPLFEADGSPMKGQKETKNGFKTVIKTDFIGRRICLGDPAVLQSKELDTSACHGCASVERMVREGLSEAMDVKAARRFAYPVVRYDTVDKFSAEGKLRTPVGGDVLLWGMSQWTWNRLGDTLPKIADLLELPLEEVTWSHVDILAQCENTFTVPTNVWPTRCAWRHPSETGARIKAVIMELWLNEENRPTDAQLRQACGREPDLEWMKRDFDTFEEDWRRALDHGKPSKTGSGALSNGTGTSLADDLNGLLGEVPASDADLLAGHPGGLEEFAPAAPSSADDDLLGAPVTAPAKAAAAPSSADDDLLGGAPAAVPAAAKDSAPAAAATPAAADVASFDELMGLE
jgi:hypothetical protein